MPKPFNYLAKLFKKDKSEKWKIEMKYRKMLGLEEARLIFSLAEAQLLDSLDTNKLITEKTMTLLNIVLGALVALVGFSVVYHNDHAGDLDRLLNTAIFCSIYLFILSVCMIVSLRPMAYCVPGTQPKKLFNDEIFHAGNPPDHRQIVYFINLIQGYQESLVKNRATNATKSRFYKISLIAVVLAPLIFACYYLLI